MCDFELSITTSGSWRQQFLAHIDEPHIQNCIFIEISESSPEICLTAAQSGASRCWRSFSGRRRFWSAATSQDLLALVAKQVGGPFPLPMDLEPYDHWDRFLFVRLTTIPPLLGEKAGVRADVASPRRAVYFPPQPAVHGRNARKCFTGFSPRGEGKRAQPIDCLYYQPLRDAPNANGTCCKLDGWPIYG